MDEKTKAEWMREEWFPKVVEGYMAQDIWSLLRIDPRIDPGNCAAAIKLYIAKCMEFLGELMAEEGDQPGSAIGRYIAMAFCTSDQVKIEPHHDEFIGILKSLIPPQVSRWGIARSASGYDLIGESKGWLIVNVDELALAFLRSIQRLKWWMKQENALCVRMYDRYHAAYVKEGKEMESEESCTAD